MGESQRAQGIYLELPAQALGLEILQARAFQDAGVEDQPIEV